MEEAVNNPHLVRDIVTGPLTPSLRAGLRLVYCHHEHFAKRVLRNAIDKLDPPLRDVIIARYGEGLTHAAYGRRISRSRERARALAAKALRRLRFYTRNHTELLRRAITEEIIPNGPLDPAWVTTQEASDLTGLTRGHIRYLAKTGKVKSQRPLWKPGLIMIDRQSLREYVTTPAKRGQKKRVWKGGIP